MWYHCRLKMDFNYTCQWQRVWANPGSPSVCPYRKGFEKLTQPFQQKTIVMLPKKNNQYLDTENRIKFLYLWNVFCVKKCNCNLIIKKKKAVIIQFILVQRTVKMSPKLLTPATYFYSTCPICYKSASQHFLVY